MSVINVSVSGGTGSTTTATTGDTVDVVVGNLSVGTLPALQIAAGTGITIATSNGVSTISANLSTSVNLDDLADVQTGASSGQVLGYNGTSWSGLTLAIPSNLADLANVQGTPTAGQVLAWNGTAWEPADDQTGGASDVANLADLNDVSAASPSSGQALTWDGSQWAAANVPVGTTINGLSGSVTLVAGDNINVSADGQNITIDTIGQASISNLTDLVDVNATMSPTSGQALVWNGSEWTADSVTALVSNGTTLDLGTGKILYSNVYDTLADLPTAADYHGMFAHVHNYDGIGTGAAFYAHAGGWVRLADNDNVPTTLVSTINGLSGALVLSGGSGISISQSSSQLTISSTATSSTINGQTGQVSLVGGNRIDISTSDGTITASANLTGYATESYVNSQIAGIGPTGIVWGTPPGSPASPGSPGDVAYDDNYFYLRTSQAWRQVPLQGIATTITIYQQPSNVTVADGDQASFTVLATAGGEAISYQWASSSDGVNFADVSGATSNTLTINAALVDSGLRYRALLSAAGAADVTTSIATLTVSETFRVMTEGGDDLTLEGGGYLLHDGLIPPVTISVLGPTDQTTTDGSAVFSVTATASDGSTPNYQWQKSEDGGASFSDLIGAISATLSLTGLTAADDDSDQYRVIVDSATADQATISAAATLTATPPSLSITQQPQDTTAVSGSGSFTVAAEETTYGIQPTYQWQALNGAEWLDIQGETGGTLSLTGLTAANDGQQYRAIVTASSAVGDTTVVSDSATLTVPYITITQQPSDATAALVATGDWTQLGSDIDGEAAGDYSGQAVAVSSTGARVIIGASRNDGAGQEAGHVRVYDWDGSTWAQVGADIDGDGAYDYSGDSVAISGDGGRIAIGSSQGVSAGGSRNGHVRVYDWSGSAWVQVGSNIDGEAADDRIRTVSMSSSGTRIAFGAYLNDGNGTSSGHTRVYDWNGTSWTQVGGDIDGEAAGDQSGWSVSISGDGDRVAIGATLNSGGGAGAGHVRVYEWSGSAWSQVGSDIDGEAAYDNSGNSVAMSENGDRLIIGAYRNDDGGASAGHARVFDWSGSAWVQVGEDIDGDAAGDESGQSVSISSDGSRVAIGARVYAGGADTEYGRVRVYEWSGSAWSQVGSSMTGEAAGDWSGYSVAISGDGLRVASGAPFNDGTASSAGHVRVYELPSSLAATFSVSANSSDGSALTYQWQKSEDGVTFADLTGETATTISLTGLTPAADSGDKYRAVVTTASIDPVASNAATLSLDTAVSFTLQPQDTIAADGEATLTSLAVEPANSTTPTYQWQKFDGSVWVDLSGETANSISLTGLTIANDGDLYRVVATPDPSVGGVDVASEVAEIRIPTIATSGPTNQSSVNGEATFSVTATSSDGSTISYQWQSLSGGVWSDIAGETGASLALAGLTGSDDGSQFRVTVDSPTVIASTTSAATLTVPTISVVSPTDQTASGGTAEFSASATSTDGSALTYQWQRGVNQIDESGWVSSTLSSAGSTAGYWDALAYGNGTYIAINRGTDTVLRSSNGVTWYAYQMPSVEQWSHVAYGDGLFVAIANASTGQSTYVSAFATSTDGTSWTAGTLPEPAWPTTDKLWSSLVYGNGVFVAMRGDGMVLVSRDGVNWVRRATIGNNSWTGMAFGDGLFVAVATDSSKTRAIATSADGATWTVSTPAEMDSGQWRNVAYGNGRYVLTQASNNQEAGARSLVSFDGTNWVRGGFLPADGIWYGFAFGGGIFAAVGRNVSTNGAYLATSTDSFNWSAKSIATPSSGRWYRTVYGGDSFVVTGSDNSYSAAKNTPTVQFGDLANETGQTLSLSGLLSHDDSSLYRIVVDSPTATAETSNSATLTVPAVTLSLTGPADQTASGGIATLSATATASDSSAVTYRWQAKRLFKAPSTWASQQLPTGASGPWNAITYGGGVFCAVESSGKIARSTDGSSWSSISPPVSLNLRGVAHGDGVFIAVAGSDILVSGDATSWSSFSPFGGSTSVHSIAFGDGLFCAIGSGGDFATSSNSGQSWATGQLPAFLSGWRSVSYGEGRFIAVGSTVNSTGNTNVIASSFDGVNWVINDTGGSAYQWRRVVAGNGVFVRTVTGQTGQSVDYLESGSGLSSSYWTARALPSTALWDTVEFVNGLFVAISYGSNQGAASHDGLTWVPFSLPTTSNWNSVAYGDELFVATSTSSGAASAPVSDGDFQYLDIPGQIASSVQISSLRSADDGSKHRVIVDSPSTMPTISQDATITVP